MDRIGRRRAAPDVGGVLFVVAAAVAVMLPALLHGSALGPYDLLSRYGLTKQSGVMVHNSQTTDLIAQMIPWTSLAWTQVHHGQLPLWNPYNGLGMPLAFNWQSATFGLPTLIGYLAPLRLAYTVQVMVTVVLAGTGTYVLGRVLRLGVVASAMAGVVYELSGTFMGFLGWPIAAVLAWAGWLFTAALLIVRGQRRVRAVVFFAVSVAGAVYAGQPDALVLLAPGLLVFIVVLLGLRARSGGGMGTVLRPVGDLVVASVAGAALAAPLILPGFSLTTGSVFFHAARANGALSAHDVVNLVFQGYNALPVAQGHWFGVGTSAYVGVIALVLAVTGAVVCRRRPEVLALVGVSLVMAAVVFVPPLASLMNQLPFRCPLASRSGGGDVRLGGAGRVRDRRYCPLAARLDDEGLVWFGFCRDRCHDPGPVVRWSGPSDSLGDPASHGKLHLARGPDRPGSGRGGIAGSDGATCEYRRTRPRHESMRVDPLVWSSFWPRRPFSSVSGLHNGRRALLPWHQQLR